MDRPTDPKAVVSAICELFAQRRYVEAVERYFAPDYIEHNPEIPGGNREGFLTHLREGSFDQPGGGGFDIEMLRIVAEGDEVALHIKVVEPGKAPLSVMEFYRIENGLAVEHWDVMQAFPLKPRNTSYPMA